MQGIIRFKRSKAIHRHGQFRVFSLSQEDEDQETSVLFSKERRRSEMRSGTIAGYLLRVKRYELLPAPPSPKLPLACASCSSAARLLSSVRATGGGDGRTMARGEVVTLGTRGVRWWRTGK